MNEIWNSVVSSICELTEAYEGIFVEIPEDCLSFRSFVHRSIDENIECLRLLGDNSCVDGEGRLVLADDKYKLFGKESTGEQPELQAEYRKEVEDSPHI